jgi:hypothetical protein
MHGPRAFRTRPYPLHHDMTLVIAASGKHSIWMMADTRLSYDGRPPKDGARKIVQLDTPDGPALIGYSGLGATPFGNEPSDWIVALLRNRGPISLCEVLEILRSESADALARHLASLENSSHTFVVNAFVAGRAKLYGIQAKLRDDGSAQVAAVEFREGKASSKLNVTPRLCVTGSGGLPLIADHAWERDIMRAIDAHDDCRISAQAVAQVFANRNFKVHRLEETVGPNCWVSWRLGASYRGEIGSGHMSFTGTIPDANTSSLPTIANGMDVAMLADILMAHTGGDPLFEPDADELNAQIKLRHTGPDSKLR